MKKQNHPWLLLVFLLLTGFWQACTGDNTANDTAETEISGKNEIDQVSAQITQSPKNAELYALRAELYYEKNSYDLAIEDMTAALTLDDTNLGYHHLLADIYLDYFRSRLALQTMERAIAIAPEHIPSLLKLSEIQLFLKKYEASMITINRVLKLDPQNALAFFFMGKNFEETGDINRAINSFQEASENDPEMLDAWIKLGQLHAEINGSLAEDFFDNAIEIDSMSSVAIHAKAEYRWSQDDPQGALELYKTAIRKAPLEEKSYYNAGLVYLELDSLSKAYEHFNMAIENAPLYVAAYYYRGYAAEISGDNTQAKSDYEHALRLSPDYQPARDALARVN